MVVQPYDRKKRALTVVPEKASTATPAEKHTTRTPVASRTPVH